MEHKRPEYNVSSFAGSRPLPPEQDRTEGGGRVRAEHSRGGLRVVESNIIAMTILLLTGVVGVPSARLAFQGRAEAPVTSLLPTFAHKTPRSSERRQLNSILTVALP